MLVSIETRSLNAHWTRDQLGDRKRKKANRNSWLSDPEGSRYSFIYRSLEGRAIRQTWRSWSRFRWRNRPMSMWWSRSPMSSGRRTAARVRITRTLSQSSASCGTMLYGAPSKSTKAPCRLSTGTWVIPLNYYFDYCVRRSDHVTISQMERSVYSFVSPRFRVIHVSEFGTGDERHSIGSIYLRKTDNNGMSRIFSFSFFFSSKTEGQCS